MNLDSKIASYDAHFFEVKAKDLTFTFCNVGASIYSLYLKDKPLILELNDLELFLDSNQYFNKTLGITAGRLKRSFEVNGKHIELKNTKLDIFLHGGEKDSLTYKEWDYEVKEDEDKIDVIFKTEFKDDPNGLIGKGTIYNIYHLSKKENVFEIEQVVDVLDDMIVNLSNHIYWNLNRSRYIDDYFLQFDSPTIGSLDDRLLIIGEESVPSHLNFKEGSKLKERLDITQKMKIGTIDNTFVFNKEEKLHKVLLEGNGIQVLLETSYPAMNIYCDSSMSDVKFNNLDNLKERRGIALEPQKFIYDLNSVYYKKGEEYRYFIRYSLREI